MTTIKRETKETKITLSLEVYGSGNTNINTGIGFFDHMLNSFAVHGGFDLEVDAIGDIYVDCHHVIEDVGIVLGKAFCDALGDKGGINRFGTAYVPMDEALAFVSLDISGRPFLVYDEIMTAPMINEYDTQMTEEFFRAFSVNAGITLHAKTMYGKNAHHIVEAMYKALARALKDGVKKNEDGKILSAKGVL